MRQESTFIPKLLFVAFQTASHANGGLRSLTHLIAASTADSKVTVITNCQSCFTSEWRAHGANVIVKGLSYCIGSSFWGNGVGHVFGRIRTLISINFLVWKNRSKFDVLHCNDPAPFWHSVPAARLLGKRVILNLRDTKSDDERLDLTRYRWRFAWCDLILVLSQEMKEFYGRVYAPSSTKGSGSSWFASMRHGLWGNRQTPIEYIYSTIDFEVMRPLIPCERAKLRHKLGILEDEFAIGYVATFNDKKNQLDYLGSGVPKLAALIPGARTWFIGDFLPCTNEYAMRCLNKVHALGLSDMVQFVGYTPMVHHWYQACDVIVVPTRKEGLARCMIEALACATPVISFDVSSAREILEIHQCGKVVRQGNYESMVAELKKYAEDPRGRTCDAQRGLQVARRLFSQESMMAKYRQLCLST